MGISRRAFVKSAAATTVAAPFVIGRTYAAEPILVASINDLSGGLEASGKPMNDVLHFASR